METRKKTDTKKYKESVKLKGAISLIVLVITIIVIIILATMIIISIVNNNPISEANKARFQSDRDNMQGIFTNTVAKVMAINQGSISIRAGVLNEIKSGVNKTIGIANYVIKDGVDGNKLEGTITFDNKENTDTKYYTGKKLPIYKVGETTWYVDEEGILTLRVGNTEYVSDGSTINKGENDKPEILPPLQAEVGEIVKTSAKEYKDKDGKIATIPIGFAIVPGKDVVKDGLVISDVANDTENVGNQFVWIPVDDISTFRREAGYYKGQIQTSVNWYIDFAKCEEPYSSASETERKEYENMINSVKEYKGFYIGRYEMSRSEDGSAKAQSKKNKTPWVNIAWGNSMTDLYGGIVYVARNMYQNREDTKKGEVVSTLIYGTAWDEVTRFLKTNDKYKNIDKDSTGFGNVGINCNDSGYDTTNKVIATGSNEKYSLNNIYDIVGNVWEWTMESYISKSINADVGHCVRGGANNISAYYCPITSRQSYNTTSSSERIGGRVQLYIK